MNDHIGHHLKGSVEVPGYIILPKTHTHTHTIHHTTHLQTSSGQKHAPLLITSSSNSELSMSWKRIHFMVSCSIVYQCFLINSVKTCQQLTKYFLKRLICSLDVREALRHVSF